MTITIKFTDNIEHKHNSVKDILQNKDKYHTITYIDCNHKNLFSLPELPNSLKYLRCSNNGLSVLPELPNSLTHLWCYNNNLSSLPELSNSVKLYYKDNPIHTHINKYFDNDMNRYFEHQTKVKRTFTNKIGNWYLECKYNPKYLYCRTRLMKEYEELYN